MSEDVVPIFMETLRYHLNEKALLDRRDSTERVDEKPFEYYFTDPPASAAAAATVATTAESTSANDQPEPPQEPSNVANRTRSTARVTQSVQEPPQDVGSPNPASDDDDTDDVMVVREIAPRRDTLNRCQQLLADRMADRISDRIVDRISSRVARVARAQFAAHHEQPSAHLQLLSPAVVEAVYRQSNQSATKFAMSLMCRLFGLQELSDPSVTVVGKKPGCRPLDEVRVVFIRHEVEKRYRRLQGVWSQCVNAMNNKMRVLRMAPVIEPRRRR